MVKALDRKLLRDLTRLLGQVVTIAVVVACGVATFITFVGAYRTLEATRDEFYAATRFADVFAACVRAPRELERDLAEIPGIAQVDTRLTAEVTFDMPRMNEPISGRLVSWSTGLDVPIVRLGRSPERADEAVVAEAFAKAHQLAPGDAISALVEGRRQTFRIVGLGLSPEYVFAIAPGSMLFDDARYGVVWVDRETLAAAVGKEGAFDDVALRLAPGASEAEVMVRVDALLAPYGGVGAVVRADQSSHHYVQQELGELRTWATLLPTIFVGVAAFLLNVVLSRLVGTQREQIAALKAFGYGDLRIAAHFLQMIVVIVVLGAVAGTFLGWYLGAGLTEKYTQYFRFPALSYRLEAGVVLLGTALTFVAAAVGGLGAVRAAVRLSPAEGMRPPVPAKYRRSLLERLGLSPLLSNIGRIIVRNVGRRPLRTFASVVGIGFSTAIITDGLFFGDVLDVLVEHQFERVMREDMIVTFRRPVDTSALRELGQVPGVLRVEGSRIVPVALRSGHREKRLAIFAFDPGSELRQVLDKQGHVVPIPPEGLVLSTPLAGILGVSVGDSLEVRVLDGARVQRTVTLVGLADEMFGLNAYMQPAALHRLLGEQETLSAALLAVDARALRQVEAALKSKPAVAGVTTRGSILDSFASMTGSWMLLVSTILSLFAASIAFGVVYNTARINLAERERELASLRVLGFTIGEITTIFTGELAALVVLGIPVGFVIGRGIAWVIVVSTRSEGYHFPIVISAQSLATAALVVLAAAALSTLIVRRALDRLDLVGVLKTRD